MLAHLTDEETGFKSSCNVSIAIVHTSYLQAAYPQLSVRLEGHFHRKMVADGESLEGEG